MSTLAYLRVKFRKYKFLVFVLVALTTVTVIINHRVGAPYESVPLLSAGEFDLPILGDDQGQSRMDKDFVRLKKPSIKTLPKPFKFPLPEQKKKKLPKVNPSGKYKIQASVFENGGGEEPEKLEEIRSVFLKSWNSYKKYAINYDEVLPLSHEGKDPFVGWSITLLDTLDTLHLMGFENEFEEAIEHVTKINFHRAARDYIPTFETVIRALGGLVSAYDLSRDPRLLSKAIECADVMIGAFDTPNHMPLLFYRWSDDEPVRLASTAGSVAEFGTLFLEFTRLAQLTGNETYYHYVQNIIDHTDEFVEKEKEKYPSFKLNGLFPTHLDISGCKALRFPENGVFDKKKQFAAQFDGRKLLCERTGLEHPRGLDTMTYTLGGLADSYYEYLIKQYHMFNAAVPQYLRLFKLATKKIKKYMLYKAKLPSILLAESNTVPHLKSNPDDVLFLAEFKTDSPDSSAIHRKTWVTHLSCFAGGMFGLSGRITGDEEEVEIGKKLTNGCYKLYELMELMPEWLILDPCPEGTTEDDPECQFDVKEKIKTIRLLSEGKEITSDDELLEGIELNGGYASRFDNLEESSDIQSEDSNDLTEKDRLYRNLNADKKNFKEYTMGRDGYKYSTSKLVKFPKSAKPPSEHSFNDIESDVPPVPLTKAKNGDIIWRIGENFNVPLWMNNMESKFILRPELIESVMYMYRITGDLEWREKAWKMFKNTVKHTAIPDGAAALRDVSHLYTATGKLNKGNKKDSCESFWFAETLKYYYLLYSDKDVWSLDDYVFNTEAHPYKRE